jgi:hypothetical protein
MKKSTNLAPITSQIIKAADALVNQLDTIQDERNKGAHNTNVNVLRYISMRTHLFAKIKAADDIIDTEIAQFQDFETAQTKTAHA